jgi:hypothetical protein
VVGSWRAAAKIKANGRCVDGHLRFLFFPEMARDDKPVRLRPVDEETEPAVAVIRLENVQTEAMEHPVRLELEPQFMVPGPRLALPSREEVDLRTHQPGVEVLLDALEGSQENIEESWAESPGEARPMPWGWFVLVALCAGSGVLWSLMNVKEAEKEIKETRQESISLLDAEEEEEREALRLVDRVDAVARACFLSTTVQELLRHVRHPERVGPMMRDYYQGRPVFSSQAKAMKEILPLTLGNRGNFMKVRVVLANGGKKDLIVELLESGEPRIDWETMVGYQPMEWTEYALKRPKGESMDFRVVASQDNLYSHEFADSTKWLCLKLIANDSEETLFGYAPRGGDLEKALLEAIRRNGGRPAALVLRLIVPEGIQSRRGVVIEKLMSPQWIYLDPPDTGA